MTEYETKVSGLNDKDLLKFFRKQPLLSEARLFACRELFKRNMLNDTTELKLFQKTPEMWGSHLENVLLLLFSLLLMHLGIKLTLPGLALVGVVLTLDCFVKIVICRKLLVTNRRITITIMLFRLFSVYKREFFFKEDSICLMVGTARSMLSSSSGTARLQLLQVPSAMKARYKLPPKSAIMLLRYLVVCFTQWNTNYLIDAIPYSLFQMAYQVEIPIGNSSLERFGKNFPLQCYLENGAAQNSNTDSGWIRLIAFIQNLPLPEQYPAPVFDDGLLPETGEKYLLAGQVSRLMLYLKRIDVIFGAQHIFAVSGRSKLIGYIAYGEAENISISATTYCLVFQIQGKPYFVSRFCQYPWQAIISYFRERSEGNR